MRKLLWFFLSIAVIIADQVSKHYALVGLDAYQPYPIMPMLNFTLAYNTGAAFSFLSTAGAWHQWLLTGFSLLVSFAIVIWMIRSASTLKYQLLALSLILGGAIGNLIDRLRLGYVIDFIDVYYKSYHWPIFNIADSAITIGTFIMALYWMSLEKKGIN